MTITVGSGVHVSSSNLSAPFIGTATSVGTTATVTYTVPATDGGVPIQYYVATSSPGNLTGTANQAGSGSVAVSGLTLSQPYTFTVQAYNWFGLSPSSTASNTITPAFAPCAPFIGTATAAGGTSVTVSYTAPTFNGGAAITSYVASSSSGSITATLSQAGSGTITVTGLTQGTPYSFSVRAVNRIGPSVASTQSNTITLFSVPCAPTIGTAVATGQTSATVAFTAPANNGGSAITKYIATSSPGSITATLSQAGSGTITVTGLSGLTAYTFKITATSSIGTSADSGCSNSITTWRSPGSCSFVTPGTYCWTVPSGIYSVSVVTVGAGSGAVRAGGACINYRAGSGGGLAYVNNRTVTPGSVIRIIVGAGGHGVNTFCGHPNMTYSIAYNCSKGGDSSMALPGGTIKATGGTMGYQTFYGGSVGGYPCGGSGGNGGGGGGTGNNCYVAIGGGGAGGYSGNGGNGGYGQLPNPYNCGNPFAYAYGNGSAGSGGAGGGGGASTNDGGYGSTAAGFGGGVGLFGQGSNGAGGVGNSSSCQCGKPGSGGCGSKYGGGAPLAFVGNGYANAQNGSGGAVRIVWPGSTRQFPSTCVGSP
jgi:hypothetical protein